MQFKFNSSIFKNSPEDHQRLYGDKYDPNKNYPVYSGSVSIPKAQIPEFVEYLHWALRTKLKADSYLNDVVIPIKVSGWQKTASSTGKKFLSLAYEPDYKTMMAAKEAQEASQSSASQPTAQDAAASLAKGTGGSVVQTQQDDVF